MLIADMQHKPFWCAVWSYFVKAASAIAQQARLQYHVQVGYLTFMAALFYRQWLFIDVSPRCRHVLE